MLKWKPNVTSVLDVLEAEGRKTSWDPKAKVLKQSEILKAEGQKQAAILQAEARERAANETATEMVSNLPLLKATMQAVGLLSHRNILMLWNRLAKQKTGKIIMLR